MSLFVVGLNHTTASIELRERVVFSAEQTPQSLRDVCTVSGVTEAIVMSTCNRTELVAALDDSPGSAERAVDWFAAAHDLPRAQLEACLYRCSEADAMRHLIEVASGLDSMVVGEPQIFGQLKSAHAVARQAGSVGAELSRAMNHVFTAAKRVRSETGIGENPVSIAYAAVKLARRIFSELSSTTALLVGAGATIELVARHLTDAGVRQLIIANRTLARGEHLAVRFGARAVLLADIPEHLPAADIVISSTASQLPLIGKGTVERAIRLRKHKPMFMVDLAVPRDIEAEIAELSDVYLYSIDDLEQIVADNRRARDEEAGRAAALVDAAVESWLQGRRSLDAVSTLRELREHTESLRDQELEKTVRLLRAGADPEELLAQLARNLTNKFLHAPSVQLRRAGADGRRDLIEWSRRLLGMSEDGEQE
jgi:glutamyl-tRNA reductase